MQSATIISVIDILLGVGVMLLELCALLLLIGFFRKPSKAHAFVTMNAVLIGFLLSFGAVLGTLYYSEIVGLLPCRLCWFQRAFLYPQVLMFAYGVFKKDARALLCTSVLSFVGLLIALYHISLPLWTSSLFCDPASELCLVQSVHVFGYITIPVMSASVFAVLFLVSIYGYRNRGSFADKAQAADDSQSAA